MNNDILLKNNIVQICYETTQCHPKHLIKITKHIIQFYCDNIIGTCNMYIAFFISNKLKKLHKCIDGCPNIYRKTIAELYILLAICNKPTKDENKCTKPVRRVKVAEAEALLTKELKSYRDEDIILACVGALYKSKGEVLWRVVCDITPTPKYVNVLYDLNKCFEKKELLFEAFRTLIHTSKYFYDNGAYSNIIFQCIMKLNYIYEEKELFDKHMEVYIACLNCPLGRMVPNKQLNVIRDETAVVNDCDNKSISFKSKEAVGITYFEKKNDNVNHTANNIRIH
uniref:Uncharacterized protein n=1 Tax=Pyramimonas orientalis virus TaxID=455367 RepID=A0A7L9AYQ2_POV01|nr:hypothetical protein HWQ62_00243 [Pyramimonas orientalis virus]